MSFPVMENIRFRRAKIEDKADILKLRDGVHGGSDILPSMIDHILSSPKFIPGVMLDGTRIVSNTNPLYSETCLKRPLKKVFKTNHRFMQVKSIAECSVFKTFVLSIFEW